MRQLVCAIAWHNPGFLAQQNSLRDAILAALNIDIFARHADRVRGANISASKVDSVNTFDAPNTVVPKPISARAQAGKLILQLEPNSVTVVPFEQ